MNEFLSGGANEYAGNCVECGPQFSQPTQYSCGRNHTFCDFCFENVFKLTGCETCSKEGRPISFLTESPGYDPNACRSNTLGCKFVSTDPQILQSHNEGCKFRSLSCEIHNFRITSCYWHGYLSNLAAHFEEMHPGHINQVLNNTLVVAKFSLNKEQTSLHLIRHDDELFYYKHKLDLKKGKFYVTVQMIGLEEIANKYFYQYLVKAGDRTMNLQEMCHSDGMLEKIIFEKEKCAVIPVNTLKNYVVNDELYFEFSISRVMA